MTSLGCSRSTKRVPLNSGTATERRCSWSGSLAANSSIGGVGRGSGPRARIYAGRELDRAPQSVSRCRGRSGVSTEVSRRLSPQLFGQRCHRVASLPVTVRSRRARPLVVFDQFDRASPRVIASSSDYGGGHPPPSDGHPRGFGVTAFELKR